MKAHQDIFTAKLHELEQQYECLRKRLEICNAQSHRQIHRELESARQEYNSLELRLKQIVKNSLSVFWLFPVWQKSSLNTARKQKGC